MAEEKRKLGRKWQFPLTYALGALPVLLALSGRFLPQRMWAEPVLLAVYAALAWVCMLVPGKRRHVVCAVGCAVLAGAAWLLMGSESLPVFLASGAVCIALLVMSAPIAGWKHGREVGVVWTVGCAAGYLVVYSVEALHLWPVEEAVWPLFSGLLTFGFLAYMLLTLLAFARANLDSAATFGKVPEAMRRRSTVLVVGLMALVTVIACIPVLAEWLRAAAEWAALQGLRLLELISRLFAGRDGETGGGAPGGAMDLSGVGEAAETSPLMAFLERVVVVAALVILAVLIVFLLRVIWRRLRILIARVLAWVRRYTDAVSEDYIDEVTSTLDDPEHEDAARARRQRRRTRRVDPAALSPSERIRWRYRQLRIRHPEWSDATTARESLPENAAALYERVRYGEEQVTQREAEAFARESGE